MIGEDVEEDKELWEEDILTGLKGLLETDPKKKNRGGLSDVEKNDQRDGRI